MTWRLLLIAWLTVGWAVAAHAQGVPGGAPGPTAGEIGVATDIRLGVHSDHTRVVIDLTQKVEHKLFALADPDRIVVDLPEVDWRVPKANRSGGGIEALRFGPLQPGVSRLVIDLARPAKVLKAFVLPPGEGKAYRLVIDLGPVDRAQFMAALAPPPDPVPPPAARAAVPPPRSAPPGLQPPGAPGRKPERERRKIVVIDPGHGGVDPGAIGPTGIMEKDLTLAAARDFKRKLEATRRYEVHLTRDNDMFIRLRDRIAVARAKGADLFISIHMDKIASRSIRGLSVYTLSEKASDKEAADLAEKENKADLIAGVDLTSENPEVTNILIDLAQRETMNESSRFAGYLVGELRHVSKTLSNAHRFAGFAVLKAPDVPSILLEMGFLSNRDDERQLTDPAHRARMGDALVQAVGRYFRQVEKADRN